MVSSLTAPLQAVPKECKGEWQGTGSRLSVRLVAWVGAQTAKERG
jgi:hypothetical protein